MLDILKAFSALTIKDYGIENDENFMNTLNQQADKIEMFYKCNDDNVHHSFLSSVEVEAAELYGVNVDFS